MREKQGSVWSDGIDGGNRACLKLDSADDTQIIRMLLRLLAQHPARLPQSVPELCTEPSAPQGKKGSVQSGGIDGGNRACVKLDSADAILRSKKS